MLNIERIPKILSNSPVYRVLYCGNNGAKVAKLLYNESRVYLDRKKERANIYIDRYDSKCKTG